MVWGWVASKKDDVKDSLRMLNMPDLSQNLGNLRSWNLIGKENNYFIFENKNIPYVIHVKFDYLNSSYLNLLLYKKDKDKANLIIRITAINNVDHIKK